VKLTPRVDFAMENRWWAREDLNLGPLHRTSTRLMTITFSVLHDEQGLGAVTPFGGREIRGAGLAGCTHFALVINLPQRGCVPASTDF
jgi:hypothetical protein